MHLISDFDYLSNEPLGRCLHETVSSSVVRKTVWGASPGHGECLSLSPPPRSVSPRPLLCGFSIFGNSLGEHFPHLVINSESLIHAFFHALTNRIERVIVENVRLDAVELRRHRGRSPSPEALGPSVGKTLTAELRAFPELCCKHLALPSCRTLAVTLEDRVRGSLPLQRRSMRPLCFHD